MYHKFSVEILRCISISCFLDALKTATTRKNCLSAFEQSGIFPIDIFVSLNSHWIVQSGPSYIEEAVHQHNRCSQCIINSHEIISTLLSNTDDSSLIPQIFLLQQTF